MPAATSARIAEVRCGGESLTLLENWNWWCWSGRHVLVGQRAPKRGIVVTYRNLNQTNVMILSYYSFTMSLKIITMLQIGQIDEI